MLLHLWQESSRDDLVPLRFSLSGSSHFVRRRLPGCSPSSVRSPLLLIVYHKFRAIFKQSVCSSFPQFVYNFLRCHDRRGVGGPLYPKPAIAGPNPHQRLPVSGNRRYQRRRRLGPVQRCAVNLVRSGRKQP